MAYRRFIDRTDKTQIIKGCSDFRERQHGLPTTTIIYLYCILFLSIVVLVNYLTTQLLMLPDTSTDYPAMVWGHISAISFLIILTGIFSSVFIHKIRRIIIETEFQNLLFTSSLAVDSNFCLIANTHKVDVFYDANFSAIFHKEGDSQLTDSFARLTEHEGFKKSDKEKLVRAVIDSAPTSIPFSHKQDGKVTHYDVSINPLNRPKGFCFIKAVKRA